MSSPRKLVMIIPSSIIFFLLVPLLSLFFGRRLDVFLGFNGLESGLLGIVSSVLFILVGGYYVVESIRILLIQGGGIPLGDVFPEDQSTELITSGVYGQTRNPMLFGYILCLMALGILMESISITFIIPIAFIIIWTMWLKKREEPALEARFGITYRLYREKTPFLVPRPWRKND